MAIGRREGRRQLGNGADKYVQVVTVRHDHGDRPGKAHDQRALKDILGAVQEHFAGLRKIMAGEHTRADAHHKEKAGHLRNIPAEPDHTVDVEEEAGDDERAGDLVLCGKPGVFVHIGLGVPAELVILIGSR